MYMLCSTFSGPHHVIGPVTKLAYGVYQRTSLCERDVDLRNHLPGMFIRSMLQIWATTYVSLTTHAQSSYNPLNLRDTLLKDLNHFRIVSPQWARQKNIYAPYLNHVQTSAAVRFLNTCFSIEMLDPQLCVSVQTLTLRRCFNVCKGPGGCWKWKSPTGPISGFFLFPFDWLPSRLGYLNADIFFQQHRTSEFMPQKKRFCETGQERPIMRTGAQLQDVGGANV